MACGARPNIPVLDNIYTILIDGRPSSITLSQTRRTDETIFLTPRRSRGQVFGLYEEILRIVTEIYRGTIRRETRRLRILELQRGFGTLRDDLRNRLDDAVARNQIYYLESLRVKFENFRAKLFGTGA